MLRRLALVLGILLAGTPSARAHGHMSGAGKTEAQNLSDQQLLDKVHAINQEEIQMGQLGQQRASNPQVKDYASRLVSDHTSNDQELMALAGQQGISVQAEAKTMAKGMKDMDALKATSGRDFDRKFLTDMVEGHQHALGLLRSARAGNRTEAMNAYLDKTIQAVDQHRQMASDLLQKSAPNTAAAPTKAPHHVSGAGATESAPSMPVPSSGPHPTE